MQGFSWIVNTILTIFTKIWV